MADTLKITGENWSGHLVLGAQTKARGRVNGYSWYLQLKSNVLLVEIAEDPSIEPADLPMVGFGCGGWLYESKESQSLDTDADAIGYVDDKVQLAFALFREKQLDYLPAITCPCSDL
ncbi:hypothetical protein [Leucothrix arctica]|uniref:Uncharacterized protein n=1 Tax=Leucothrix arctica TaxID=1481894 RepID=A0A317CCI8_9GAMM|nr:hypothetical protein [Leucothrix arctica]PWQ96268.1 hypothetical protein DKT75_09775 [Leucothrix arctica]